MIKETLLRRTLFSNRLRLLEAKKDLYGRVEDSKSIREHQVRAFNAMWSKALAGNAFYRAWRSKHGLPATIASLAEIAEFPALTKLDIRRNRDEIFRDLPPHRLVSTGGSTGEPTPFPTRNEEKDWEYANTYLGKSWWGVDPLDPILMYWGHSHLFGKGPKMRVNRARRDLGDWLINTRRENAYDMTPETLSRYLANLRRHNPVAIIGYTSCLYQLSKYALEKGIGIGKQGRLKAVIPTSETVTSQDIELIHRAFGAPVAVEYGMAETGVIAYSRGESDRLCVFWDSFVVEAAADGGLFVTTLNDRLFPLVRYRTDDFGETEEADRGSALYLRNVKGRTKESVAVAGRTGETLNLSGILLVHILKGYPGILGINFKQLDGRRVQIRLSSDAPIDLHGTRDWFFRLLLKDHPDVREDAFDFAQVNRTEKTVAGKEKILC